jgi:AcrR family transcriptional regulator
MAKKLTKKRGPGRPRVPMDVGAIVATARDEFARRGVEAVSLREVAERAGMTKAALYYHFPNKAELYAAVLDEDAGAMLQLVSEARLDEGSFAERLDRLGALVSDYLGERPAVARLFLRELVGQSDYLEAVGAQRVRDILEVTAAFLAAGIEAGGFRREDPRQLAVSIAGLHLFAFAAADVVSPFLGADLFARASLATRKAAVLAQVRHLCGVDRQAERRTERVTGDRARRARAR